MSFTALQWMGPELAKAGLVRNEAWIVPNVERAVRLFCNQALHPAATLLAAVHPRAIDYIEQAPVLVLAATAGARVSSQRDRERTARTFAAVMGNGPKLRDIMTMFKVAPSLRALSGNAIRPGVWPLICEISARVDASSIAQSLPLDPTKHMNWLTDVGSFWTALSRRAPFQLSPGANSARATEILRWAMFARGRAGVRQLEHQGPSELADFLACEPPSRFNPRWTWDRALQESLDWHNAMAVAEVSKSDDKRLDDIIDYGRFPLEAVFDGFQFVALRTLREMMIEGRTMHHCVASYYQHVKLGESRIYSIRKDGRQIATAELAYLINRSPFLHKYPPTLNAVQIKGPCNKPVSEAVRKATAKLAKFVDDDMVPA